MKLRTGSMLQGPLLPSIITYTIPIILTSLIQLLFNAADLVIVGRFCGGVSVAAVGATGAITNLIVSLFIGLATGAGVCVAHGLGSREDEVVCRTVHTAIPLAVSMGLILTVIGVGLAEKLLILMGTPETVLPLSTLYMRIYFGGMVFNMIYNFAASILRAAGDTRSPLVILSIAGALNVLLNVVFVTALDMNVAGVALATALSQAVSAVWVLWVLMRREDACRFSFQKMHIYKAPFYKMLKIGLPAGIQGSVFAISNVIIQSSVNSFGDVVMSGNAAAGNIEGFIYVTQNAFYQTTVNFVGQNVGAGQYKRAKKSVWLCTASVIVVGVVIGFLAWLGAPRLLSIYITDSQEAIRYGVLRMTYICLPYFLCGAMDIYTGALRSMGNSLTTMLITILGICGFRIGWIMTVFQIPQYHTLASIYLSYPISWAATFLIQFVVFLFVYRKQYQKAKENGTLKQA